VAEPGVSTTEPVARIGRRERKKQAVSQRIRDAALELFREKGYEAATVEEIAERADVAKGTFFNHFPRKDALLAALAEDVAGEVLDSVGPVEVWEGSSEERLLELFIRVGDLVARDPELSKVMMVENMRSFWLRTQEDPIEQEVKDLIRQALSRAVARGEVAGDADVVSGAKLLEAAHVTTMIDWLKAGAPGEVYKEQLSAKFEIIFRGLGKTGQRGAKGCE
jgi:TetR/AcrR family transcriptional regulator, cholesterol catabolism regulator